MDLPALRHFRNEGIYSDQVEALVGEAWVPAFYTGKGWTTADGANLLSDITEWRHASKEGRIEADDLRQHQSRDESRQATKASSGNRTRKSR